MNGNNIKDATEATGKMIDKTKDYAKELKLTKQMASYLFLFVIFCIFCLIFAFCIKDIIKCLVIIGLMAIICFCMSKFIRDTEKDRLRIKSVYARLKEKKKD